MVLAEIWTERRLRRAEERGRAETQMLWEEWLKRREEAEAKSEPFDEPPPSLKRRR